MKLWKVIIGVCGASAIAIGSGCREDGQPLENDGGTPLDTRVPPDTTAPGADVMPIDIEPGPSGPDVGRIDVPIPGDLR